MLSSALLWSVVAQCLCAVAVFVIVLHTWFNSKTTIHDRMKSINYRIQLVERRLRLQEPSVHLIEQVARKMNMSYEEMGGDSLQVLNEIWENGMKMLPTSLVLLTLCACSMSLVHLEGCQRSYVVRETAKDNADLRKHVEKELGTPLEDDDLVAHFMVHDEDLNEFSDAIFVGRNEAGEAAALEHEYSEIGDGPYKRISFGRFFQYLECEMVYPADEGRS